MGHLRTLPLVWLRSEFNATIGTGTPVKFEAPIGVDTILRDGVTVSISTKLHCISCMKAYENKSLEELRMEDYGANRKGVIRSRLNNMPPFGAATSVFPFSNTTQSKPFSQLHIRTRNSEQESTTTSTGTVIKFKAPVGRDTQIENRLYKSIRTRLQCITAMKEYENKCLEELRMEDYAANRKGVDTITRLGLEETDASVTTRLNPPDGFDNRKNNLSIGGGLLAKTQERTVFKFDAPTNKNKLHLNCKEEIEHVKENFKNLLEDELICNICTELLIKPITLGCSHTFCQYCILVWKEKKDQCPLCRSSITTETRCLFLDNFINKAVEQLDPENLEKRLEIIRCRDAEKNC